MKTPTSHLEVWQSPCGCEVAIGERYHLCSASGGRGKTYWRHPIAPRELKNCIFPPNYATDCPHCGSVLSCLRLLRSHFGEPSPGTKLVCTDCLLSTAKDIVAESQALKRYLAAANKGAKTASLVYQSLATKLSAAQDRLAQSYADLLGAAEGFEVIADHSDSPNRENILRLAATCRSQADKVKALAPMVEDYESRGKRIAVQEAFISDLKKQSNERVRQAYNKGLETALAIVNEGDWIEESTKQTLVCALENSKKES